MTEINFWRLAFFGLAIIFFFHYIGTLPEEHKEDIIIEQKDAWAPTQDTKMRWM